MAVKEDQSMGVEWSYLKSLLNHYNVMVERYSKYLLSRKGLAHHREKLHFQCSLSVFYSTVQFSFDAWLRNSEKKDLIPKYQLPPDEDNELVELYSNLNVWAQSAGPFATLVKKNDPFNAFKDG